MKRVITVRIDEELYRVLREANINISRFINNLLFFELKKNNILKVEIERAEAEREKKRILEEMRIIGAIRNIEDRIREASRLDLAVRSLLIKRAILLLSTEYKLAESEDVKALIRAKLNNLKKNGKEEKIEER